MSSSYVQRKERLSVGEELAISATVRPSGQQISVYTLLPTLGTVSLPKRNNLKFHPVIVSVSKFVGLWVMRSPHHQFFERKASYLYPTPIHGYTAKINDSSPCWAAWKHLVKPLSAVISFLPFLGIN